HGLCDRRRRRPRMAHQRDPRSNYLALFGGASTDQSLKGLAIFSRQLKDLRLASSTHASEITSLSIYLKDIYRISY
ncbi:MAG: hypothetical protein Q8S96_05885, partial [Hydrogenophaga sp.]|uniref:hypothetical protein n=1 Tax=Hydrogenophaga sp. TaxID=1904254 RepID=UPI0027372EAC